MEREIQYKAENELFDFRILVYYDIMIHFLSNMFPCEFSHNVNLCFIDQYSSKFKTPYI